MADQRERLAPKFRRVVTGHDASGKAVIWIDGDATNQKFPNEKISSTLMWSTAANPTKILGDEDEGARILGSAPPPGGSRFTMMEFHPGNEATLHRTDTVDYVICIAGEIEMTVDESKFVTLRAGDVLFSAEPITPGPTAATSRVVWPSFYSMPCRSEKALFPDLLVPDEFFGGFDRAPLATNPPRAKYSPSPLHRALSMQRVLPVLDHDLLQL
jgi:quercetin dioxygenase-like cupin family protein